jgi:DeoR family ulaG and ulaABCDEF operon transcriptional repressor
LHHAEVLLRSGKNRVIMLGGELVGEQGVVVSPFRWTEIEGYYASKIFLGAQALGPSGVLQTDPNLARCEQHLLAQAERVVVLVDSSKLSKHAPVVVAPLDEIDVVVTDSGIDAQGLAMLRGAGIEVIVDGEASRATSAA